MARGKKGGNPKKRPAPPPAADDDEAPRPPAPGARQRHAAQAGAAAERPLHAGGDLADPHRPPAPGPSGARIASDRKGQAELRQCLKQLKGDAGSSDDDDDGAGERAWVSERVGALATTMASAVLDRTEQGHVGPLSLLSNPRHELEAALGVGDISYENEHAATLKGIMEMLEELQQGQGLQMLGTSQTQTLLLRLLKGQESIIARLELLENGGAGRGAAQAATEVRRGPFGNGPGEEYEVDRLFQCLKTVFSSHDVATYVPLLLVNSRADSELLKLVNHFDPAVLQMNFISTIQEYYVTRKRGSDGITLELFMKEIANRQTDERLNACGDAADAVFGMLYAKEGHKDAYRKAMQAGLKTDRATRMRALARMEGADYGSAKTDLVRALVKMSLVTANSLEILPGQTDLPDALTHRSLTWDMLAEDSWLDPDRVDAGIIDALDSDSLHELIDAAPLLSPQFMGLSWYALLAKSGGLNMEDDGFKSREQGAIGKLHRGHYIAAVARLEEWFPNWKAKCSKPPYSDETGPLSASTHAKNVLGGRSFEAVQLGVAPAQSDSEEGT